MLPEVDTEGDDAAADEAFLERTRLEGGVPLLVGAEAEAGCCGSQPRWTQRGKTREVVPVKRLEISAEQERGEQGKGRYQSLQAGHSRQNSAAVAGWGCSVRNDGGGNNVYVPSSRG